MKRVTLAIAMAALVVFAGCKKDKETTGTTLRASIEQQQGNGSKTSLDPSNGAIKWTAGDKIVVNNGTTTGTFTLTNGAGTTSGTFTYNGEYTFDETNNIGVYPETATIEGNTVTVTMPAEKNLTAPGIGMNPMLGNFTDPNNLTFTSLCGVLGISLKAASGTVDITAVEVVSKADEKLNGTFTANANAVSDSLMLVKSGTDGTNSMRLNCMATLTTTEAQNFFFALPVGALSNGFTLNVYGDGTDPIYSTNTDKDITIVLNQVNQMPAVDVALPNIVDIGVLSQAQGSYTVQDGDIITGTATGNFWVYIPRDVTVTLRNVSYDNSGKGSLCIMCHVDDGNSSGTTNIILEGNNTVEHIKQFSSVQNLNISGDGSLTLTGNQSEFDDGCNTVIDGGTITANRLTVGLWSGGNTLTINDGTIHLTQGFWTYLNDGNTTDITINGGDITVGVYYEEYFGGQIYPGIGGNSNNTNKIINVTVNDGTLTFNATDNGYPGNYFIQASTINFGTTNVKSAWDAKTWSADGYQNFGPLRATYTASSHTLVLEPAPAPVIPEGAINSLFSVSATQQVYFSQGNLQYTKSTGVWSFMEHQYDIVETAGTNVGVDYANQDIISLFGHGTSGYNHGATAYQPWSTVLDCAYYYAYGNQNGNLYDSDGTADWGYNAISNGGNTENSGWRTPTHEEWEYLFFTRTDASSKYGYSIVNGLHGMIVLPDEWTLPAGLSFTGGNSYWANVYDADQWAQMEYNGAIFLPATCYRRETTIYDAYESMFGDMEMYSCFYWSSSKYNLYNAWYLGFSTMMNYGNPDYILQTSTNQPFYGYSVRLVKDAE